jgi:putative methionine-R-sulfoxide reductase with GAF domain
VSVADVVTDSRYFKALGTMQSEIVVPAFDEAHRALAGTIDVESQTPHASASGMEALLQAIADAIRTLWSACALEFGLFSYYYPSIFFARRDDFMPLKS